MKIIDILNNSKKLLESKNFKSPLLDCKILLSNVLNLTMGDLVFYYQENINDEKLEQLKKMLERRLNHEPISKIINKKSFWNYDFYVNKNVLDPRPDSESLIEMVLKDYDINDKLNILDLGSGSGCLILTLLKIFKNSDGVAVDISEKALEVIKKNSEILGVENLTVLKSNWNNDVLGKFDIIISNPPYIESDEIAKLSDDVKNFDPILALNGGCDGLDCYRYIAKNIKKNCKKNTRLYFEIGNGQKIAVKEIFVNNGFEFIGVKKDFGGVERVLGFVKK